MVFSGSMALENSLVTLHASNGSRAHDYGTKLHAMDNGVLNEAPRETLRYIRLTVLETVAGCRMSGQYISHGDI